jgi:hypothetical protein
MIDPRANSTERLDAPATLPHISRRALSRVKNPIPAPTVCPYDGGQVDLVNNSEIYKGKSYGEWPYAYLCRECGAYVGLHPHTDIPLGTLADAELRRARNMCKAPFVQLYKQKVMTRDKAYAELAKHMGLDVEACHFGWFDIEQCKRANNWAVSQMKISQREGATTL